MKQITAERVKKDNSNIRKFSDPLWRALRKERFKKAKPNMVFNELAAEEIHLTYTVDHAFNHDVENFIKLQLTEREASIFRLFAFGGRMGQVEIAETLGVCQATVANDLKTILGLFKEFYYGQD